MIGEFLFFISMDSGRIKREKLNIYCFNTISISIASMAISISISIAIYRLVWSPERRCETKIHRRNFEIFENFEKIRVNKSI